MPPQNPRWMEYEAEKNHQIHQILKLEKVDVPPNYMDAWGSVGAIYSYLVKEDDVLSINLNMDFEKDLWVSEIEVEIEGESSDVNMTISGESKKPTEAVCFALMAYSKRV